MAMKNVKERIIEVIKEWDEERLRIELEIFVKESNDSVLTDKFFADIATEEEYQKIS